jgi:signal transduction histidine kinase
LARRPRGIVVFGISPKIALNDFYRSFFDLAAAQIATAISNARGYEQRQRAEALAAIDRAKTTIFSNVSHEFRTPLTLILGRLEEALREARAENQSASRQRLELIWRNSLRLQKLVDTGFFTDIGGTCRGQLRTDRLLRSNWAVGGPRKGAIMTAFRESRSIRPAMFMS